MLKIIKILFPGLLILMLTLSLSAQNTPEVSIENLQYINGTQINDGDPIEIDENGEVTIQFTVDFNNPNGVAGVIEVYSFLFDGGPRNVIAGPNTVFGGGTFDSFSYSVTLTASNYASNSGSIFAGFRNTNNNDPIYASDEIDININTGDPDPDPDTPCDLPATSALNEFQIGFISARLQWNIIEDDLRYTIEVFKVDNNELVKTITSTFADNGFSHFYIVSGLNDGTEYLWTVRGLCPSTNNGGAIAQSTFTTLSPELTCFQPAPTGTNTSEITSNSVKLSWNQDNVLGYEVGYRQAGTIDFTSIQLSNASNNSTIIENLEPSTDYEWAVRSRCLEGGLSFFYTQLSPFTTTNDCPVDLTITDDAIANEDNNRSAEISIMATNVIPASVTAAYDAGNSVVLKPGFISQSGSVFRAYIEGCIPTRNSKESTSKRDTGSEVLEEEEAIAKEDLLLKTALIYPNPAENYIQISSNSSFDRIEIINQVGASITKMNKSEDASYDMSTIPKGVYFMRIYYSDGQIATERFIKK